MTEQLDTTLDPEEQTDLVKGSISFPVVGMGASAGGLPALLRFFENMPAGNGMAFVVIIHLSPEHESNAAAILQRVTRMPVQQVVEPTPIQADHVYVIPPTHDLSMNDGYLRLVKPERIHGQHVSIDLFFRTLGEVHSERSVCVVMSGTGADGAVGLARVKERGGITLVQSPEDAEHDGMPKAAIATGMVDFVLSAVEMPQKLTDLWANATRITLPKDADPSMRVLPPESVLAGKVAEQALGDIMSLLRTHSKNDFRHYKRATVLRRIERRLQVRSLPDLPTYRDYLRDNPDEARPLLQDMLISVTNFFRDRDAFEALERQVLPNLVEGRTQEDTVRVWVAGSATGEEAYSVSILLHEAMDGKPGAPPFQVFATDIDEKAISKARTGLYPESIFTDVTPVRLRQFFTKESGQLRVNKLVREKVLFAHHNILRDPPFSKLDMVCCRNLLIYLDREAQTSILEMFRFALKPGGYLFLGTSESADAAPNLFTVVDKKNRIYRSNPHAHAARHLPLGGDVSRDRSVLSFATGARREKQLPSFAELHQQCIDELVAPSVLVDDKHTVLHLSATAGRFLMHAGGAPSLNLLSNVEADLRTELRTALFQVNQADTTVVTRPVPIRRGSDEVLVKMTVKAFQKEEQPRLILVLFEEVQADGNHAMEAADPSNQLAINQLEAEIRQLKDNLQDTIEHAETSTEELKASNEELQAINEELRSATEELETSKEELQSMNEELITVNFELKVKVEETGKVNDDLQNLVASSDIATVFIDRAMRIKRFTPQAATIFNLISSDINRSLLDITHKLDYGSLAQDTVQVFRTLNVSERQIGSADGRHYLARIRPYRTVDDRIDGAVLTFIDVTELQHAEEEVQAGRERLRLVAETTRDYAIITMDEAGIITTWNFGAERMFGYREDEIRGKPMAVIFTPEDQATGAPEHERNVARESGRSEDERWHMRKDGTTFYCSGVTTVMEGEAGGFAKIARDMTEKKNQQSSRDELLAREQASNESKDQFLAVMSHELKHPLNLIQVNTELLISQPEVRSLPAVVRSGETIRLAIESQTKIIDDLLDLSRARTGKLTLRPSAVDLKQTVLLIVEAAKQAAQQKGLTLKTECDDADVIAFCDRVRTEQIFWNLINNAMKFTPAGGQVTVCLNLEPEFARFRVIDTGQGISPEFLPQVFGMFAQAPHTPQSQNTGLGVGLTLVRDLAVAQGGKVLAQSEGAGLGATFTVWLPLNKPEPAAAGKAEVPFGTVTAALEGKRVLAVDDMLDSLEPFAELLRLEGAEVDIATSGATALEMMEKNSYDLLISDLGMDGMDGFQLIREVRQRPALKDLPALALSGYGRPVDVKRALQSGFTGHLPKPATLVHIRLAVAKLDLPAGAQR